MRRTAPIPGRDLLLPGTEDYIKPKSEQQDVMDTLQEIIRNLRQKLEVADKLLVEYDTQLSLALDVIFISQKMKRPATDGYIKIKTIHDRRAELRQHHARLAREDN